MVFYESVHRVRDSLADMCEVFGNDRAAFVGRELTKMHEQCIQAALAQLLRQVDEGDIPCKGEFVIIVAGTAAEPKASYDVDLLLTELSAKLSAKDAASVAAKITGAKRNDLYARILKLRDDK
jgi:16S rRNA (cytidine1402-2'-O)-methyltransferase